LTRERDECRTFFAKIHDSTGEVGQPMTDPSIADFDDFLSATRAARFADYAARPETRVAEAGEFTAMKQHILEHYKDVEVVRRLRVGRQIFDCVARTDRFANSGESNVIGCPPGSIPIRRTTLDELTRCRSLRDFFRKDKNRPRPVR
jgi:hypothetical protein